jgi:dephospho-CoA kinase
MVAEKLLVGLAGMPGVGKSLVVNVAKERLFGVVVMGDIVREEAEKRHMEPNPENIGKLMLDLRRTEGTNVIAKRCMPKIESAREQKIIVDGIRSLDEVEEFMKHYPKFTLIAVHASPETRFRRLYRRRRSDDADSWKVFYQRDERELSVGLGNAVALAEFMLVNEEPFDVVKKKASEVLRKVEERWMR